MTFYLVNIVLRNCKKIIHQGTNHQKVGSPYVFVVFSLQNIWKHIQSRKHDTLPTLGSGRGRDRASLNSSWKTRVNLESNKHSSQLNQKRAWNWENYGKLCGMKAKKTIPRAKKASCQTQWCGMRIRDRTPFILLDRILQQLGWNDKDTRSRMQYYLSASGNFPIKGSVPCIPSAPLIVPAISHKSTSARLSGCFCLGFARIFPFKLLFFCIFAGVPARNPKILQNSE